jgi:hypothetical protein
MTVAAVLSALFAAPGCERISSVEQETPGITIESASQLTPDQLPYVKANLILAGTPVAVSMERYVKGNQVHFLLTAHGETIEEEVYESGDGRFAIKELAGETYDPPLPILQFPLKSGDMWQWQGNMVAGGISRKASAKVGVASDKLNLASGNYVAMRSTVELEMSGGGPNPAKRTLAFWFVKDRGIIKRDIAASSTREPRIAQD